MVVVLFFVLPLAQPAAQAQAQAQSQETLLPSAQAALANYRATLAMQPSSPSRVLLPLQPRPPRHRGCYTRHRHRPPRHTHRASNSRRYHGRRFAQHLRAGGGSGAGCQSL
jgi:hypothetical protein